MWAKKDTDAFASRQVFKLPKKVAARFDGALPEECGQARGGKSNRKGRLACKKEMAEKPEFRSRCTACDLAWVKICRCSDFRRDLITTLIGQNFESPHSAFRFL